MTIMDMTKTKKQTRSLVLKRHVDRLGRNLDKMEILNRRFSWIRLAVVMVGGIGTFLSFYFGPLWFGRIFLILSIAGFAITVYYHRRLDRSILRFQIALRQTRQQVARMNLDWDHIPPSVVSQKDPAHPFEIDLDLTGERSVHQLINSAISQGGTQRLADWLLERRVERKSVMERQALVQELKPMFGFRNRLGLNSVLVSENPDERWDGKKVLTWLEAHTNEVSLLPILILLSALSLINIVLFLLSALEVLPPFWIASFILYAGIYYFKYKDYKNLFGEAYYLANALNEFRAVLVYLERYSYRPGSRLAILCKPFWDVKQKPSKLLNRIGLIASAASLQRNPIIWFFLNMFMPWDLFFVYQLALFKRGLKSLLPVWLDTWYQLEALNSLGNFGYLNPDAVFPMIIGESDISDSPVFKSKDLGHPLIPDDRRVCNDFSLNTLGEIVIITGSNMAGKSTFLRTLGVNLALAFSGGVVVATEFQTRPVRLFTCINVIDSLNDGISYFYAEVQRLKALLNELERHDTLPLFFLIDEIFRGTNNREREIGSRAFVNALTGNDGVGVISTHDLELIHLEDNISGILNYHFREDVEDGRMVFDYCLRRGPCPTTNALKIMRMEGLPVEFSQ